MLSAQAATVSVLAAALLSIQGALMLVDELVYHRRRGLGLFESLGHPLDTASFLAALLVPALLPPAPRHMAIFIALALFSALIITKDEAVHAHVCQPVEHWLHAMLFVVHAPCLIAMGWLWVVSPDAPLLAIAPLLVGGWGLYQLSYWLNHHIQRKRRARLSEPAASGAMNDTHSPRGQQCLLRHPR